MPGRGDDIHMDDEPIQHVDGIHIVPRGVLEVLDRRSTLDATCQAKQQGGRHPQLCARVRLCFHTHIALGPLGALDEDAAQSN